MVQINFGRITLVKWHYRNRNIYDNVVVRKIGARSNENDNYIILSFIYDNIVICNNCNGKEIPILQVSEKEKEK